MNPKIIKPSTHLYPKDSKVLVRVDFNVPINNRAVIDESRILLSIPTLKLLIENNNAIVLISHLGRPKGFDMNFSMRIVLNHLKKISFFENIKFHFCSNFIEKDLENKKRNLKSREILILENLRFEPGEKNSCIKFSRKITSGLDFYINDAFAVCHRGDASVNQMPNLFGSNKLPGLLLQKEIKELSKVIKFKNSKLAIIGGSKISSKVELIKKLTLSCQDIIIGGAMAFSFIKYLNGSIGISLYEEDQMSTISSILIEAKNNNCTIHLPVDVKCIKNNDEKNIINRDIYKIPHDEMGLDIGTKSCLLFKKIINKSKTIIWNGPMGVFEKKNFEKGTESILKYISNATKSGSYSLVGGGDTLSAISNYKKNNIIHEFSFQSSGGGAMLEFLQNPKLPGIKSLLE
ncbi:MAG: phosphoglycerate kinase [Flavobacteriales bacterium]|nr:phosphoglycerate kinase [Flavobacteriales bacterium]